MNLAIKEEVQNIRKELVQLIERLKKLEEETLDPKDIELLGHAILNLTVAEIDLVTLGQREQS